MSDSLRIGLNCLLVAAVSYGALWAMVMADEVLFKRGFYALGFFAEFVPRDALSPTVWIYDVIRFAVFGAGAAILMLFLKPRIVPLYALASIVPLVWILRPFGDIAHATLFHTSLISVWLLTIPLLYWTFCRISENRHNKPFKSDTGSAGSS